MRRPVGRKCHLIFPACGCKPKPSIASTMLDVITPEQELVEEVDDELDTPLSEPLVEGESDENAIDAPPKVKKRPQGRPKTPWAVKMPAISKADVITALSAMSVEQAQNLLAELNANKARRSLAEYSKQAWSVIDPAKLDWNWHHQLICDALQGVMEDWMKNQDDELYVQRVRRILINIPPGTAKSTLISVFLPTWMWLHVPGWKVLCLSVNEDAMMRDARKSRDLIRSEWYQKSFRPSWSLNVDQNAVSSYANSKGGSRLSKAIGSEIVGLRGDCIILDDPNDPNEAENKATRDATNTRWNDSIYNRVNDLAHSVWIGVQQRTNAEDWSGYVLKTQGAWSPTNPEGWLHMVLPAEFELSRQCTTPWGNDPRTTEGESLHTKRFTPEVLAAERVRFGSNKYAGQMQQRPTSAEGGVVKRGYWSWCRLDDDGTGRFERGDRPRPAGCDPKEGVPLPTSRIKRATYRDAWELDWLVFSVDPATKRTEDGSNWGILVVGGKGGKRYVLDDKTQKGDYLEISKILVPLIHLWKPDRLLIEDKAAGAPLMTSLKDLLSKGEIHYPVVIEPISPDAKGNKEDRMEAVSGVIEAGLVHLHEGCTWLEEFVEELALFPNGANDDRADALSQVLSHMMAKEVLLPSW